MSTELQLSKILKSIGKNSLIYGISTALQPLAGFILLPLYSENFERYEFGLYTLILLISTIFSTIFHLGINSAFIRSYYDYDLADARVKVFNTSLLILLIGLFLQVIICFMLANFLSVSILKDNSYVVLLIISVITTGIGFVNTGLLNYLRVEEKVFKYAIVNSFTLIINVTSTLYLFEYFSKNIISPIYSALFSQTVLFIILLIIHKKDINLFNINKSEIKIQLHFGLPSIFAGFAIMIGEWGDKLLINELLSKDELGIFSMGFRISMVYNVIFAMPFALFWSPFMMKIRVHTNAKQIFSQVTYYYFAFSIIFIFIVYIILEPFLNALGFHSKFVDSLNYVPFLMFAIALGSLQNIYGAGISFARKPKILAYIYTTLGCLNFAVSYFTVSTYGIYGLIITFALFKFFTSITIYYFSSKYFSFQIFNLSYVWLLILLFIGIFIYSNFFSDQYTVAFLLIYMLIFSLFLFKNNFLYVFLPLLKVLKSST